MKRALADPNICPALSVKQGPKFQISATGDWREARAPVATIYRMDHPISEPFALVSSGSYPAQIAALDWSFRHSSGIDAMVAVSLIFRFGRRQNSPSYAASSWRELTGCNSSRQATIELIEAKL